MEEEALIGKVIDNFEIQEVIGHGGMGIVFRAYHPDLQRNAAIKIMRQELATQPGFFERFLQEARTAARLDHPNIVYVSNFGRFEDSFYITMEYIDGPNLRHLIRENSDGIPLQDVLQIFIQIADVLDFSHKSGVLHRDLKPDNILLTETIKPGLPYRAIVTDFGLVKLAENSILETQAGVSVGTPAYMSPEQCFGREVDGRTDIYALGVMLYESCTGKRPYPIRNLFDAAKYFKSSQPVSIKAHIPGIPVQLDALVRQMLTTEVERRPASAAEVVQTLRQILNRTFKVHERSTSEIQARILQEVKQELGLLEEQPKTTHEPESATPTGSTPSRSTPPGSTLGEPRSEHFFIRFAYQDEWQKETFPVTTTPLIVGRDSTSHIVLDYPERYVSKKHCEILLQNDRVLIRDLRSTNGTTLGEIQLDANKFYEWTPGTSVYLGPCTLELRDSSVVESPPAKAQYMTDKMTTTQVALKHTLVCAQGQPARVPIAGKSILIGRAPDCDMVLEGPRVSRHHLKIQKRGNLIEVIDMNSTNGSLLNNHRLPPNVPVPWDGSIPVIVGSFSVTLESSYGK